jgi:hypothetical protein
MLDLSGVLRNSHQTWATGIMLVGERARPGIARGASEGPRAEEEAMDAGMGAHTTRIGALVGAAMMVLPLVREHFSRRGT